MMQNNEKRKKRKARQLCIHCPFRNNQAPKSQKSVNSIQAKTARKKVANQSNEKKSNVLLHQTQNFIQYTQESVLDWLHTQPISKG